MLKYKGARLGRAGFIGATLMVLAITVGLNPDRLATLATAVRYQAVFTHAGGLVAGNDVKVSGVKVGSVSDVALRHGKAQITFTVDADVALGTETTAHIRTGSLLGQRILTLESQGPSVLPPAAVIPQSRTGSPYSLTDAVGDLAANAADTDTAALNRSLDTLSDTLNQIAPQLGPAFEQISRLSRSLNNRDETLSQLLRHTAAATDVLAKRSDQLNTLILNANDLVATLTERRQAIVDLLANTAAVATQVSGLVSDNEQQLAPTLEKLNSVTAMLEKNRDNIGKALPGLAKYQVTQGETVANGFYYNAFIPNLALPEVVQPFLDYLFGFRRGPNRGGLPNSGPRAGLPDAGPRAEIPFPYNGIPGGSR